MCNGYHAACFLFRRYMHRHLNKVRLEPIFWKVGIHFSVLTYSFWTHHHHHFMRKKRPTFCGISSLLALLCGFKNLSKNACFLLSSLSFPTQETEENKLCREKEVNEIPPKITIIFTFAFLCSSGDFEWPHRVEIFTGTPWHFMFSCECRKRCGRAWLAH